VALRDWEQLCTFEERFKCNTEGVQVGHSGIVHLYISIEDLWNVAYPEGEDDQGNDRSDTSDETYILTDSEEDYGEFGNGDGDDNAHGSCTDEGGDGGTNEEDLVEEQALEFSHFSELESQEITDDTADLGRDGPSSKSTYTDSNAQDLAFLLLGRPTAIARLEFPVYSALRRLLTACAPTLESLFLSWKPISTFFLEALFPVLPVLQNLSWRRVEYNCHKFQTSVRCERKGKHPILFPALQVLDFAAETDIKIAKDLKKFGPDVVRIISAPNSCLYL
jgi:hypothetical protein